MTREQIISDTLDVMKKLPEQKAEEIRNILVKYYNEKDKEIFEKGFDQLIAGSDSFSFLNDEPDLYTENDIKNLPCS
jgi:uncharacterized protein YutE (UPF0331/DUF86 family)